MNEQQISYHIMVAATLIYVGFITYKFGVLSSISQSFYELKNLNKKFLIWDASFLFFIWTSITGMCCMIAGDSIYTSIAGGGLLLVGSSPVFKDKFGKYPHYIGATLSVLGTQLYLAFDLHHYSLNAVFAVCLIICLYARYEGDKVWMWWLEIFCFAIFFYGIGVYLF